MSYTQRYLPRVEPAVGQPLWQQPARRQPVWPLLLIAVAMLMVAAPAAMSGSGAGTTNPIALMHSIADRTFQLTELTVQANKSLATVNENIEPLDKLNTTMAKLATAAAGMDDKTSLLDTNLGDVATAAAASKAHLAKLERSQTTVQSNKSALRKTVGRALASTRSIVRNFSALSKSLGSMDADLGRVLVGMGTSAPAVESFANNKIKNAVAGGDGTKFKAPNIVPGSRVMSVVLPMINTLQKGGPLVARKDSAKGSNVVVSTLLNRQVPDGTNVVSHVLPYDGALGLPPPSYFVSTPVGGL